MKINFEYGDVTKKYPEYVQAQCISEDCAMGSGVVIAYRNVFPSLKEKCKEYVKWAKESAQAYPTNLHLYQTPNGTLRPYRHVAQGMVVYNMFTKPEAWMHAGYGISHERYLESLQQSLEEVRDYMRFHQEKKLAISKIACGRDQCNWEDVEAILRKVFCTTNIEICVCEYIE